MARFCQNCGTEIKEEQDICLGCGVFLNNENTLVKKVEKKKHSGYITSTGIIMIILGVCMVLGASDDLYEYPILVFSIPGLLGIVSGIITLNSKKNIKLLLISGILLLVGAVINFIGIIDVSIFMILAIIFGILNIVYSRENND